MSFQVLPPEINSGQLFTGEGAGPMLTAAAAWDDLAAELGSTAASFSSVTSDLAGAAWQGPTSAAMMAAAAPYAGWLSSAGTAAEQAAGQARAAAAAFEAAQAAIVHPGAVAANRTRLVSLVLSDLLGQNAPAIAAVEAEYERMWAQDVAAMAGYHDAASAAVSALTPFTRPPANLGGVPATSAAAALSQAAAATSGSGLPTISTPSITIPRLELSLPTVTIPRIYVPGFHLPTLSTPPITIPAFKTPEIAIGGTGGITVGSFSLPTISFSTTVPGTTIPSFHTPGFTTPAGIHGTGFQLPTVQIPAFSLPKIGIPGFVLPPGGTNADLGNPNSWTGGQYISVSLGNNLSGGGVTVPNPIDLKIISKVLPITTPEITIGSPSGSFVSPAIEIGPFNLPQVSVPAWNWVSSGDVVVGDVGLTVTVPPINVSGFAVPPIAVPPITVGGVQVPPINVGAIGVGGFYTPGPITLGAPNPIELSHFTLPVITVTDPFTVTAGGGAGAGAGAGGFTLGPIATPAVTATLALPQIEIPRVSVPGFTLPTITIPATHIGAPINIGQIATPPIAVNAFTIPTITVPPVGVTVTTPTISLPAIATPPVTVGSFNTPAITVSGFQLPQITVGPVRITAITYIGNNLTIGIANLVNYTAANPIIISSTIAAPADGVSPLFQTSGIAVGGFTVPEGGTVSSFALPSIDIPAIDIPSTTQQLTLPPITVDNLGLGQFQLPPVTIPSIEIGPNLGPAGGGIDLPAVSVGGIEVGGFSTPGPIIVPPIELTKTLLPSIPLAPPFTV